MLMPQHNVAQLNSVFMSPPTEGWRDIVFGTDPIGVGVQVNIGMKVRQDDVSHSRMTTLPVLLLLALSPFVKFDSDYVLILCPLCKSDTLWNIFMILSRNVEQDDMTCHVQE